MKVRLKPINEQVIVITGASSGIGLTTARRAAKEGAKVVLAARSGEQLQQLENEINAAGGQAVHVAADVGKEEDVRRIADTAVGRFGRIDTWVNAAGVGLIGRLDEIRTDDARRLFDTNYWGVVHGSLVAAEHLRRTGGAIVNIGSVESDRAVPLHGFYAATKHAVKAFTDALRMELEHQDAPVSVSLVKPASINTPFMKHSKNYMESEPAYPPPVYAPEVVAEGILYCARKPERDLIIGGAGKMFAAAERYMPGVADKFQENVQWRQLKKKQPTRGRDADILWGPSSSQGEMSERGDYEGHTMESSLYTKAAMHPLITVASLLGAGLAVAALIGIASQTQREPTWREAAAHPVRAARRAAKQLR
jgi:short-subunit dehydrogenase